jgi:hypothetical protein
VLCGKLGGETWSAIAIPNREGTIALKVPQGLQEEQIQLGTNEHTALRFRLVHGAPLRDGSGWIPLGTIKEDIEGFEIIRYKAPIVLVSAVDAAQQPIPSCK